MRENTAPGSPPNFPPTSASSSGKDGSALNKGKHIATAEEVINRDPTAMSTQPLLTPDMESKETSSSSRCNSCGSPKVTRALSDIMADLRLATNRQTYASISNPDILILQAKSALQIAIRLIQDFKFRFENEQREKKIHGDPAYWISRDNAKSGIHSTLGRRGTFFKHASDYLPSLREQPPSSKLRRRDPYRPSHLGDPHARQSSSHNQDEEEFCVSEQYGSMAYDKRRKAQELTLKQVDELFFPWSDYGPKSKMSLARLEMLVESYFQQCREELTDEKVLKIVRIGVSEYQMQQHTAWMMRPTNSQLTIRQIGGPYLERTFPHHSRSALLSPHIHIGTPSIAKRTADERLPNLPDEVKRKITEVEELIGDDSELHDPFVVVVLEELYGEEEDEQIKEMLQGEIIVQLWKRKRDNGAKLKHMKRRTQRKRQHQGNQNSDDKQGIF